MHKESYKKNPFKRSHNKIAAQSSNDPKNNIVAILAQAVVLLEFSGKVGCGHGKSCGETAGSKGAGTGQTTGCQGEGAAFGRTQVPEVPESLPHSAACGMAGGTLGGGTGG